jgi:hypothetical protein
MGLAKEILRLRLTVRAANNGGTPVRNGRTSLRKAFSQNLFA